MRTFAEAGGKKASVAKAGSASRRDQVTNKQRSRAKDKRQREKNKKVLSFRKRQFAGIDVGILGPRPGHRQIEPSCYHISALQLLDRHVNDRPKEKKKPTRPSVQPR